MSHGQTRQRAEARDLAIRAIRESKAGKIPVTTGWIDMGKERVRIYPATIDALERAGRVVTFLGHDGARWARLKETAAS